MTLDRKVINYDTIGAKDLQDLGIVAKKALRNGWQPYGPLMMRFDGYIVQVMIISEPLTTELVLAKYAQERKQT